VADFRIYEALLWEPGAGYFLLERHLRRFGASASHFGFDVNAGAARQRLAELAEALPDQPRKVRLEASRDGSIFLEHVEVKPSAPVRVALATEPVDSRDEFLRHKTSRREVYERALAARPGVHDVLLWNERGELTETCAANLVVELGGRRWTPPLACGLLPGTFREHLLERGDVEEGRLTPDDLPRAAGLWLVNSVRRWCQLRLVR
jgi:para-aminobenzoate synthetase/4-amino-4-deoxychorismate lyase